MTLRLMINADDFGLSRSVNEGIVGAHINGVLTSTSLMAVGKEFEHAVMLARETPTLNVGIHLTLVEESALSEPHEVETLLMPDGKFAPDAQSFLVRVFSGKVDTEHVRRELEAQFQRVLDAGLVPTHIDSHQHVHVIPAIRRVVLSLADKYGVNCIRIPQGRLKPYMLKHPSGYKRIIQMLVLSTFCRYGSWGTSIKRQSFTGFFEGGRLDAENLLRLLDALPESGACELMCHPGKEAIETGYMHWGYGWADELAALTDPEVLNIVRHKSSVKASSLQLCG